MKIHNCQIEKQNTTKITKFEEKRKAKDLRFFME